MRCLSELPKFTKHGALILVIAFFCMVFPGSLIAQEYGSISGTVYENDRETPIENVHVYAQIHACGGEWLSGAETDANGEYTLTGIPEGNVHVRACPDCSGHKYFANEWYDAANGTENCNLAFDIPVTSGQTTAGIDFELEYKIDVEISNILRADNTFEAYYAIYFYLLDNFDLGKVVNITLYDPSGTRIYRYPGSEGEHNYFVENQWQGFSVSVPDSQPEPGEYTFVVETEEFTATKKFIKGPNKTMPMVDASTMLPVDGSLVTSSMPVFAWGPVENPGMPVYYRLWINDDKGERVFASGKNSDLRSVAVPEGILQSDRTYTWQVVVYDHYGNNFQNKTFSRELSFTMADTLISPDSNPAISLDTFGAAFSQRNNFDLLVCWVEVVDHGGIAYDGSSHQVSVVYDGTTRSLYHVRSESSFTAKYEFWTMDTPIVSGDYIFTVTGPDGTTASTIDNLVLDPIPAFDQSAISWMADGTTPVFAWAPVAGAVRYRIRIFDENQNVIWHGYPETPSDLFYKVPPGVLKPESTYLYRVRAFGNHFYNLDNEAVSDIVAFTTGKETVTPYIEIDLGADGAGTLNSPEAEDGLYLNFFVKIHDARGVPGNIKSVTVGFPDETLEPLTLNWESSESHTCGIYYNHDFTQPILPGEYTFTVENEDGHIHTRTETLTVNPLGFPPADSISAAANDSHVDIVWDAVAGAAFYRLEIYDMTDTRLYTFATDQPMYSIPAGYFQQGLTYQYRITACREFFGQEIDNFSRSAMKMFETGLKEETDMQVLILTAADSNTTIPSGHNAAVYGTSGINEITLEAGACAELINFPGSNLIEFQSDAALFEVFRTGTVVTFQGSDGTTLKMPATNYGQTIVFDDKGPLVLKIQENKVKLGDQVIGLEKSQVTGELQ